MTSRPLMPKATAAWLVDNTTLTFRQIGQFCGMHELEVQAIADGETLMIQPIDPVKEEQLDMSEIERCQEDATADLKIKISKLPQPRPRSKGPRYTPVNKRGDKPDAISFLVKNHPELSDAQISKLIGTTKSTIEKIRDRSHWNIQNIKPRDPVEMGLCTSVELKQIVDKALAKMPKQPQPQEPEPLPEL